jgi:hypothetical protein
MQPFGCMSSGKDLESNLRGINQAGMRTTLPFFQVIIGNPRRRFSARTLRAARRMARMAGAMKSSSTGFFRLVFLWDKFGMFGVVFLGRRLGMRTGLSFFQTRSGNPRRRFSARTLRAARRMARWARSTKSGSLRVLRMVFFFFMHSGLMPERFKWFVAWLASVFGDKGGKYR